MIGYGTVLEDPETLSDGIASAQCLVMTNCGRGYYRLYLKHIIKGRVVWIGPVMPVKRELVQITRNTTSIEGMRRVPPKSFSDLPSFSFRPFGG